MACVQIQQLLWQELVKRSVFYLIFFCLLLVFSFLYLSKLTRGKRDNSPPSPPRLPIIGNLHQIGTVLHRSLLSLSEKYGPIILVHFGSVPTLVVSSPEIAREILKTHDTIFTNRPRMKATEVFFFGCSDIAFSPYGEYWRQLRKICVFELLSLKRVQSFQFVREEEMAELVEKIRCSSLTGSPVNLGNMMVTISNNIVSRSVLGQKYEAKNGNEGFGEISRKAMELIGAFCFEDFFPYLGWIDILTGFVSRLKETSQTLHAFLDQVIDEHQVSEGDHQQTDKKDFVDILLHLQNNGLLDIDLTRDNLKAILLDMFVGGTDTSAATMEWAMAELAKNPTIMKKAQEEVRRVVGKKFKVDEADIDQMVYLKCIIKETLRLHSPFVIARESTASVTLAGYDIPPKTRVLINSWAIQRDPKVWEKPKEFLPERFTDNTIDFRGQEPRFCPFGSGRRSCPGIPFAVMETEYVIANLLYWFDWILPDGSTSEDLDMNDVFQQVIRKKTPLSLVPVLHTY